MSVNCSKILIASPVNKNVKILREFLFSLNRLESGGQEIAYCFVDDNDDAESSALLGDFVREQPGASLIKVLDSTQNSEISADHCWDRLKVEKITRIKNKIIEYFLQGEFSHLFFVDADVLLQPPTLQTLLESEKDIIANIFWTKWQEDSLPLPQVWLKDFYTLYDDNMYNSKTPEQIWAETALFLGQLRIPGIYRVGGLGACTLIRRKVLAAGVNFNSLYNLSFWGEDRSFCIRAVALGFELYVNTMYPAYHIYRQEDLDSLPAWHTGADK